MSDALTVPAGEMRVVRLFRLDLAPEHIRFLRDEPGALADALGVEALDAAHVEILKLADLEQLGLATYLTEGCGVPEAEIAPDKAMLATITGRVLVILSRAFGGKAARLAPRDGIHFVAAYGQQPTDWTAAPLATESARGEATGRIPPRAARARARRIGGGIFAVVMLAVALVLWLALR